MSLAGGALLAGQVGIALVLLPVAGGVAGAVVGARRQARLPQAAPLWPTPPGWARSARCARSSRPIPAPTICCASSCMWWGANMRVKLRVIALGLGFVLPVRSAVAAVRPCAGTAGGAQPCGRDCGVTLAVLCRGRTCGRAVLREALEINASPGLRPFAGETLHRSVSGKPLTPSHPSIRRQQG